MDNIFYSEIDIKDYNNGKDYMKRAKFTYEIGEGFYKVDYTFNEDQIKTVKFITNEMIMNQCNLLKESKLENKEETIKYLISKYKRELKFEGLVYYIEDNKCYYCFIYTGDDSRKLLIAPFDYSITGYTEDGEDVFPDAHKINTDYITFIKSLKLNLKQRYNLYDGNIEELLSGEEDVFKSSERSLSEIFLENKSFIYKILLFYTVGFSMLTILENLSHEKGAIGFIASSIYTIKYPMRTLSRGIPRNTPFGIIIEYLLGLMFIFFIIVITSKVRTNKDYHNE